MSSTLDKPLHKYLAKLSWESYYQSEDFGTFSCKWALRNDAVICAFRGSDDKVDWLYNARIPLSRSEIPNFDGYIHCGYMDLSIDVAKCIRMVMEGRYKSKKLILTGHSLGGALSIVSSLRLREYNPEVVTFGSPKVFNKEGVRNYKIPSTHYIYGSDLVPHIPHIGYSYYKNTVWLKKPSKILRLIRSVPSVTSLATGISHHSIENYYNEL